MSFWDDNEKTWGLLGDATWDDKPSYVTASSIADKIYYKPLSYAESVKIMEEIEATKESWVESAWAEYKEQEFNRIKFLMEHVAPKGPSKFEQELKESQKMNLPKAYKRTVKPVEAAQVKQDGSNINAILDSMVGLRDYSSVVSDILIVRGKEELYTAKPSDWIIKHNEDDFEVLTHDKMKLQYLVEE